MFYQLRGREWLYGLRHPERVIHHGKLNFTLAEVELRNLLTKVRESVIIWVWIIRLKA